MFLFRVGVVWIPGTGLQAGLTPLHIVVGAHCCSFKAVASPGPLVCLPMSTEQVIQHGVAHTSDPSWLGRSRTIMGVRPAWATQKDLISKPPRSEQIFMRALFNRQFRIMQKSTP